MSEGASARDSGCDKMDTWYSFNFNISWDRKSQPKTWIDIFIIDTIVREMISKKKSEIVFWRVHRRWCPDQTGHELTFDCFTNQDTAKAIRQLVTKSNYFEMLLKSDLINGSVELKKVPAERDGITALTSDTGWPMALQEAWPCYINGCSEVFLRLIENVKGNRGLPPDMPTAEKLYTDVDNRIIEIWQSYGCDAFFHHLSAIFGYKPLPIRAQTWATF